jgi:hypothetical protein
MGGVPRHRFSLCCRLRHLNGRLEILILLARKQISLT